MKTRPSSPAHLLNVLSAAGAALLAAFLTSGCQSLETVRIQESPVLFHSRSRISPPPVQDGPVGYGFSSNQVCQALGPPNRETAVATSDGFLETWIYYKPTGTFVLELLDGEVVSIRGEL